MHAALKEIEFRHPIKFIKYSAILRQVEKVFSENDYTMCDFPLEIDGVLDNQASYYLTDYDTIKFNVGIAGKPIGEALGIESSNKINQNLRKQFKSTDRTQAFLNATLLTVVVFLAILSTMLLYSLMLSDVDEKTYEYGMLRALGFKKEHLVRVISMKSIAFSVPSTIFGVFVAFILNIGLRMVIFLRA